MRRRGGSIPPVAGRGFTLIELLVVISIIAVIVSITLPSLAGARETSRRVKCLANLRAIGQGLALYLNDGDGLLPRTAPLPVDGGFPTLPQALEAFLDAPLPRLDEQTGLYIVSDPWRCPSDRGTDEEPNPVWADTSLSYLDAAGQFMDAAVSVGVEEEKVRFAVTKAYEFGVEEGLDVGVVTDAADWHALRATGTPRNALYFSDWRADWAIDFKQEELEGFFEDIVFRFGGIPQG